MLQMHKCNMQTHRVQVAFLKMQLADATNAPSRPYLCNLHFFCCRLHGHRTQLALRQLRRADRRHASCMRCPCNLQIGVCNMQCIMHQIHFSRLQLAEKKMQLAEVGHASCSPKTQSVKTISVTTWGRPFYRRLVNGQRGASYEKAFNPEMFISFQIELKFDCTGPSAAHKPMSVIGI